MPVLVRSDSGVLAPRAVEAWKETTPPPSHGGVRVGATFDEMLAVQAKALGVDERALRTRTLLHLPRVADASGRLTDNAINVELRRAGEKLLRDLDLARDLTPVGEFALSDLVFERIPRYKADAILGSLHYLQSARPGSMNLALLDPVHHLPVSICSVSPLQWRRVANHIQRRFKVPRERILDVSRVYSSDNAPPNAISSLLSRVRRALTRSEFDLLTTAVDTNLGFTGASYRSTNWRHWMTIQPRPFLYHDEQYVSPRQLNREFGSSNLADLQSAHPEDRFEISQVRLKDSFIFAWRLRGETESASPEDLRPLHR